LVIHEPKVHQCVSSFRFFSASL